ncbi:glycosyltransferase [Pseudoalteromonas sp. B193]
MDKEMIFQVFFKFKYHNTTFFYGEGVPKVLIEAAACGRTIVTTTNPGCKDAIIDGETGLAVPPMNSKLLADAIIELIKTPSKRISMGLKARLFAEQEFDVKAVVKTHLAIYDKMLRSKV